MGCIGEYASLVLLGTVLLFLVFSLSIPYVDEEVLLNFLNSVDLVLDGVLKDLPKNAELESNKF